MSHHTKRQIIYTLLNDMRHHRVHLPADNGTLVVDFQAWGPDYIVVEHYKLYRNIRVSVPRDQFPALQKHFDVCGKKVDNRPLEAQCAVDIMISLLEDPETYGVPEDTALKKAKADLQAIMEKDNALDELQSHPWSQKSRRRAREFARMSPLVTYNDSSDSETETNRATITTRPLMTLGLHSPTIDPDYHLRKAFPDDGL